MQDDVLRDVEIIQQAETKTGLSEANKATHGLPDAFMLDLSGGSLHAFKESPDL